jgi:DNA-binding transcriptional MerR regulator
MSGQPARGYLGISEVLAELRPDYPDVSVSKIRFLETEGLIAPARSRSGYRRFCGPDLDRLRFILTAQRDQYLPLRVIRERLARLDQQAADQADGRQAGGMQAGTRQADGRQADGRQVAGRQPGAGYASPAASASLQAGSGQPAADPPGHGRLLDRRELVEAAGLSEALLTELETFGLLRRVGRQYGPEALEVARTAVALTSFGVEARHLRAVRAAAERETTMIESLVAPILRQRGAGAHELASSTASDCAVLVLRLHGALVEGSLAEAGLAVAARPGAASVPAAEELARGDARRQQARGAEGATA